MNRALLDDLVPGWAALDLGAFRVRLQSVPGRHRPALRAAFDAARTPPPLPRAVENAPGVEAAPARAPRRGPGRLTDNPPPASPPVATPEEG